MLIRGDYLGRQVSGSVDPAHNAPQGRSVGLLYQSARSLTPAALCPSIKAAGVGERSHAPLGTCRPWSPYPSSVSQQDVAVCLVEMNLDILFRSES